MNDVVIRTESVSKKFCKALKGSMFYGVTDIARGMLGFPNNTDVLRKDEFWAVQDVSFEVKQGEVLGIIGPNGSGKTTLLKMINGIFMPDKGKIEVNGRVGALIEVGAGFHPLLTGRENIYVNGAILGISKKEIDKKFDEIVEFADIGDFLDTPVKYYSSGMYVRLGFAVAIHINPDILLIDEILAVGDLQFQKRCFTKMKELKLNGTTVILVSHSMTNIVGICDKTIALSNSRKVFDGDTVDAVNFYQDAHIQASSQYKKRSCGKKKCVTGFEILQNRHVCNFINNSYQIEARKDFVIRISYSLAATITEPEISVYLYKDNVRLCSLSTFNFDNINEIPSSLPKKGVMAVKVKGPRFYPGLYQITISVKPQKAFFFECLNEFVGNFVVNIPFNERSKKYLNINNYLDQDSEMFLESID